MSTAALNYHSAFRGQAVKFQDWDSFFLRAVVPYSLQELGQF